MIDFKGKEAVVTGAASGIGRALALNLADRGAHLTLADINPAGLEETAARMEHRERPPELRQLDVGNREDLYEFAREVAARCGGVDLLINNAGVSGIAPLELMADDYFESTVRINFYGVVYGCKAFLPGMKTRPEAHIVNMSSVDSFIGPPNRADYASAKAAVAGFSESLAAELWDTSVSVSCVFPGLIKTNIAGASLAHGRSYLTGHMRDALGMKDGEIDTVMEQVEAAVRKFESLGGMPPEQAAEIIIQGVMDKKRRILVGDDAKWLDNLVRNDPEGYQDVLRPLREAT